MWPQIFLMNPKWAQLTINSTLGKIHRCRKTPFKAKKKLFGLFVQKTDSRSFLKMIIITSDRFLAPGPTCSRCDGPKTSSNCRRWPSSSSSSSMTSRVVASLTSIIGGRSFFRTALKSHLRGNFFLLFFVVVTRSVFNVGAYFKKKNHLWLPRGQLLDFSIKPCDLDRH